MKLLLLLLFISFGCFAQKDSVKLNRIQFIKLAKLDSTINVNQKYFSETLELISGHKMIEIESWTIENGFYKWRIKPKKK